MEKKTVPTVINMISIYNIILGLLSLSALPSIIVLSKRVKTSQGIGATLSILGLLPMILLNIFYIISAIGLMRIKEWGRRCVLVSSGLQCIFSLQLIISAFIQKYQGSTFINYIIVVISGWIIYYLTRPRIKDLIKGT